jgi:2-keto-4-pentenoate hydratase
VKSISSRLCRVPDKVGDYNSSQHELPLRNLIHGLAGVDGMDVRSIEKAAEAVLGVYSSRIPIAPLTDAYPEMSIDDAYAIQLTQVSSWVSDGGQVKGHKVGLTSAAMRRQLKIDQPDFGHLMDSMFLLEGDTVDITRFLQPRAEPELAFVLCKPLTGPGVTAAEAVSAIEYVFPALEIIDSRIAAWKITLLDTIADNASNGGLVLGNRPVRPDAVDLSLVGCVFYRNGRPIDTGAGGAVLGGSPVNALVWLANELGRRGVSLEAGHVVLTGAVTASIGVSPCDTISAAFDRIGTVSITFSDRV